MELSIQERLKDLRVERGLTLEQLEEQVNLSKSALGSYEAKDFKDISHYAIIKLAKFYGVTADLPLGMFLGLGLICVVPVGSGVRISQLYPMGQAGRFSRPRICCTGKIFWEMSEKYGWLLWRRWH